MDLIKVESLQYNSVWDDENQTQASVLLRTFTYKVLKVFGKPILQEK